MPVGVDAAAVAGLGRSPYTRSFPQRSMASMTLQACVAAIRDCGLDKSDIDGLAGDALSTAYIQEALGLPEVTWAANCAPPISNQLTAAVNAVSAGACSTALIYASRMIVPRRSQRATADALRVRASLGTADQRSFHGAGHVDPEPGSLFGAAGYAAWAGRYLHDRGATREHLGMVAINGRTHARDNPNAVMREPLTMQAYLAARMVRDPLCVLDMELGVDAAEAFVVTTPERARDLPHPVALVHAHSMGQAAHPDEVSNPDFGTLGQIVAARHLWRRSKITRADVDLVLAYDGFASIVLTWLESLGFCGQEGAVEFLDSCWDAGSSKLHLPGGTALNSHGGALSEGGSAGAGQLHEAVVQLRGTAGARQIPGAHAVLLALGGLFLNPMACVLRNEH